MTKILKPSVAAPQVPQQAMQAPSEATPAVQAAADAERRRQRQAAGRASTMLTDGMAGSANVGTTKLLGG